MLNSTLVISELSQFNTGNVNAYNKGLIGDAAAGVSTNIDYLVVDDCFVAGGFLLCKNQVFGDSVKLQVVDKDNVLGFGAGVVLGEYISNWYIREDSQLQFSEISAYPAKLKGGIYLRAIYASTGATIVKVAINYRLHKALY